MHISISVKIRYFLPWSMAARAPTVIREDVFDEPKGY